MLNSDSPATILSMTSSITQVDKNFRKASHFMSVYLIKLNFDQRSFYFPKDGGYNRNIPQSMKKIENYFSSFHQELLPLLKKIRG